jgi:hypothetical protein
MFRARFSYVSRNLALAGALLAGFLAQPLLAQAPRGSGDGYLDKVRRENEVAAQKAEADVRAALVAANLLAQTDPAKAVKRLKKALAELEDDTALTDARRATLVRGLKTRIRYFETASDRPAAATSEPSLEAISRRVENERRATDQEKIARSLGVIRGLQRDGKIDEARRLVDELAQRYPNSAEVQTARQTLTAAAQVAGIRRLRDDRDSRLASVTRDVDRSATPPISEMEFPKDWKEKTERRSTAVKLTDKEKAIIKALNTPINVDFQGGFEEGIKYLSELTGLPIVLDKTGLQDINVTYDSPVKLQSKGYSFRTVLKQMLGGLGLAYVIKGEAIEVTSALRAKDLMVVRTYYIGDLFGVAGTAAGIGFGPGFNQLQYAQQVEQIIQLVKESVDPSSWQGSGGSGTITYHAPTASLVIKQSAEVHALLAGGLR